MIVATNWSGCGNPLLFWFARTLLRRWASTVSLHGFVVRSILPRGYRLQSEIVAPERPPAWGKVRLLQQLLEEENKREGGGREEGGQGVRWLDGAGGNERVLSVHGKCRDAPSLQQT